MLRWLIKHCDYAERAAGLSLRFKSSLASTVRRPQSSLTGNEAMQSMCHGVVELEEQPKASLLRRYPMKRAAILCGMLTSQAVFAQHLCVAQ
jgi:hypothetical protein